MRKTLLIASMMFGASALAPQAGDACSCAPPAPPLVALERADAVFAGVVLSIVPAMDASVLIVSFRVTAVWKDVGSSTFDVYTSPWGATCGYSFRENEAYLVYAQRHTLACCGFRAVTGLCTRTKHVSSAQEDFAALGEPDSAPPEPSTWGRIKSLY